jgi:hypothetical protein
MKSCFGGSWSSNRRSDEQRANRTGDNSFRFLTDPEYLRLEDRLGDDERLLFQVWAQHGFTNFGRAKTMVIKKATLIELLNRRKNLARSEDTIAPTCRIAATGNGLALLVSQGQPRSVSKPRD